MKVKFKVFKSSVKTWEILFGEAAEFANQLEPDKLINISHACDHNTATVTVWYRAKR